MPYLTTPDAYRLYFDVVGEGAQTVIFPPACFLTPDITPLAQHRRIILYDQRNRGASDRVENPKHIGLEVELQDIETVRQFFGLEMFCLIGWSYFGAMAALYAARYPHVVEKLVMLGAIPPRPRTELENEREGVLATQRIDPTAVDALEKLRAQGMAERDPHGFCREVARVYRPRNMANLEGMRRMKADPCQHANEFQAHVGENFGWLYATFGEEWDWTLAARKITCPTLIVHGEEDLIPLTGAEEWAANIPNARLERLTGVAHFAWLEAPQTFFPMVDGFLRE